MVLQELSIGRSAHRLPRMGPSDEATAAEAL